MRLDKEVHDKDLEEKIKERVTGKVDMQLGKSGISPGFIKELESRLKKHGIVKIRVLKSFRRAFGADMKEIARELASMTGSSVYEVRGFTITLIKEK